MKCMIKFGVVISMLALLTGCGDSGSTPETSRQNSSVQQSEAMSLKSDEAVFGEANAGEESDAGTKPAADGEVSIVYFTSDISWRAWLPFMRLLAGSLQEKLR